MFLILLGTQTFIRYYRRDSDKKISYFNDGLQQ